MSWTSRCLELLRSGLTPDEAYARVAEERKAMEGTENPSPSEVQSPDESGYAIANCASDVCDDMEAA